MVVDNGPGRGVDEAWTWFMASANYGLRSATGDPRWAAHVKGGSLAGPAFW